MRCIKFHKKVKQTIKRRAGLARPNKFRGSAHPVRERNVVEPGWARSGRAARFEACYQIPQSKWLFIQISKTLNDQFFLQLINAILRIIFFHRKEFQSIKKLYSILLLDSNEQIKILHSDIDKSQNSFVLDFINEMILLLFFR